MKRPQRIALAGAGVVIVALGAFLALRAGGGGEAPAPEGSQAAPPPNVQVQRERVQAQARAAVEAERPRLIQACGEGQPAHPIRLSLSFEGDGSLSGLGVLDDKGQTPQAVHDCLHRELGLKLRIPPPGEPVAVEVPFAFP